jgi:hypothetical protein
MNIDTSKIKSTHWSDLLLQINAYPDCYDYARTISYKEFWDNCPKGEWLILFAAEEESTPHKLIVKAACQCARLALPYVKQGELRPLKAIETTERWLEDKATIDEVRLAAYATYSAADTANAAAYATYSAASAANAADAAAAYAAYAANAAYYVTVAAYSAAYSVAVAAAYTANSKKEMQLKTADIVRSIIPMPTQAVSEFERLVKMKAFW